MMNTLLAFVLLTPVCFGDPGEWTGLIASELALATMVDSDNRVPRSKCTVCKGTGRVKAGDGRTLVWRECDNCFDDSAEEAEDDEDEDQSAGTGRRRILFFTASWCGPCQRVKNREFPAMRRTGWRISESDDGHIQIIDVGDDPDPGYGIERLPTFIVVDSDGRELARHVGDLNSWGIKRLWDHAGQSGNDQ